MPYAWFTSTHIRRGTTVTSFIHWGLQTSCLVLQISILFYLKSTSFSEVAIKGLSLHIVNCERTSTGHMWWKIPWKSLKCTWCHWGHQLDLNTTIYMLAGPFFLAFAVNVVINLSFHLSSQEMIQLMSNLWVQIICSSRDYRYCSCYLL